MLIESPPQENHPHPRAAIYINNRIIPPNSYQTLQFPSRDVIMIERLNTDGNYLMLLINIYNTKNTPLINNLSEFIQTNSQQRKYGKIARVGDFNLYYPLWNPAEYQRHDMEAEDLIALMAANELKPHPTPQHNHLPTI